LQVKNYKQKPQHTFSNQHHNYKNSTTYLNSSSSQYDCIFFQKLNKISSFLVVKLKVSSFLVVKLMPDATSSSQTVGEEKRRDALVPPNPKELDRAARIGIFFARSKGAYAPSKTGSTFSKFNVPGAIP
jgi:hypothetical protein